MLWGWPASTENCNTAQAAIHWLNLQSCHPSIIIGPLAGVLETPSWLSSCSFAIHRSFHGHFPLHRRTSYCMLKCHRSRQILVYHRSCKLNAGIYETGAALPIYCQNWQFCLFSPWHQCLTLPFSCTSLSTGSQVPAPPFQPPA